MFFDTAHTGRTSSTDTPKRLLEIWNNRFSSLKWLLCVLNMIRFIVSLLPNGQLDWFSKTLQMCQCDALKFASRPFLYSLQPCNFSVNINWTAYKRRSIIIANIALSCDRCATKVAIRQQINLVFLTGISIRIIFIKYISLGNITSYLSSLSVCAFVNFVFISFDFFFYWPSFWTQ